MTGSWEPPCIIYLFASYELLGFGGFETPHKVYGPKICLILLGKIIPAMSVLDLSNF